MALPSHEEWQAQPIQEPRLLNPNDKPAAEESAIPNGEAMLEGYTAVVQPTALQPHTASFQYTAVVQYREQNPTKAW